MWRAKRQKRVDRLLREDELAPNRHHGIVLSTVGVPVPLVCLIPLPLVREAVVLLESSDSMLHTVMPK